MRYRREQLCARQPPHFPLLEDLMRDGSHGAALLAVVHYYCPGQLKLDGECGLRLWRGSGGPEDVWIASVSKAGSASGRGPLLLPEAAEAGQ